MDYFQHPVPDANPGESKRAEKQYRKTDPHQRRENAIHLGRRRATPLFALGTLSRLLTFGLFQLFQPFRGESFPHPL
jgi:hypothetical protein